MKSPPTLRVARPRAARTSAWKTCWVREPASARWLPPRTLIPRSKARPSSIGTPGFSPQGKTTRAGSLARVFHMSKGTQYMSTTVSPEPEDNKGPNISASQVKELREKTGAPMMDCKQALSEAKGNLEEAVVLLRKRGVSVAAKKATRVTSEGSVSSYIHAGGKIGVLVEVNCESDFVARTEDFKELIHDIAMHIAASDPKYVRKEDVTPEAYAREKEIYL